MAVDKRFAVNIAFPLRFLEDADLQQAEDEEIINQSLQLIVMIPQGSIPLFPEIGSRFLREIFEQLNIISELAIDTELRQTIPDQEKRVTINGRIEVDEDAENSKRIVTIPYTIINTGQKDQTRLIVPQDLAE